jgi:hypothetical protein
MNRWAACLAPALTLAAACDPQGATAPDAALALLPASYPDGFVEVRACRPSAEHFPQMRILVPVGVRADYEGGVLPPGSTVVKEEFDDARCARLAGFTLMHKQASGADPPNGDWRHQRLDAERRILLDGPASTRACTSCHARCRTAQPARDFVCAEP